MKSLVVLLCLATVALADITPCSKENRDCSCGDRSYFGCEEPSAQVSLHVDNLEECILNCDLFHTMGQCDWIIFYNSGPDENCRLIATAGETMEQYLNSCNVIGQPIHHVNGHCMYEDPSDSVCSMTTYCKDGYCDACSPDEKCEKIYHETECTLTENAELEIEVDGNTFKQCTKAGIISSSANPLTYVTWDKRKELCDGYPSGKRNCLIQVIKAGATITEVNECKTG